MQTPLSFPSNYIDINMEFVKPAHEKLAELDQILQGWIHRRRAAISDGTNPARVNNEISNIKTYIERCHKQIAELENRRDNWKDIVEQADTRIAELRLEIDGLKGPAKVVVTASPEDQLAEIIKIAGQLGLSPDELAAMMAASAPVATGAT